MMNLLKGSTSKVIDSISINNKNMKFIKIIEVEPKEGLVLKAVEVASSYEHVSPCCNRVYHRFYCQNRLAEESWYHKIDASGDIVYNKKITILDNYIVIPEFDNILKAAEDIDFSKLNY